MDSKIRRMAILASLGMILLVSLLVLYTNGDIGGGGGPVKTQTPEETKEPQGGQAGAENNGVVNGQIGDDLSAFLCWRRQRTMPPDCPWW